MGSLLDVLARYDELADLLTSIDERPLADPAATAMATVVLHRESRWLDRRCLGEWLGSFTPDAVLWVPLQDRAHPAADQSWFLDDRRRLGERVSWHGEPSAWGQHPPSTCVRTIGSVEAWPVGHGMVAHSTFTLLEHRRGEVQLLAGRQVHELVGDDLRCRSKILLVPGLAAGLRNPSFLL